MGTISYSTEIQKHCKFSISGVGWLYITGICISEVILTIRVWAVWQRDMRLTVSLPILFVICWTIICVSFGLGFRTAQFLPTPPLPGCWLIDDETGSLRLGFIMLTVYEFVLFILVLIPGISDYRHRKFSPLLFIVYRDGIMYYTYILILSIINIISNTTSFPNGRYSFLGMEGVMYSILTSHTVLHIRRQARKGTMIQSLGWSSGLQFAEREVDEDGTVSRENRCNMLSA